MAGGVENIETPAELVKNLAAAIGLPEPTVTVYARVLREAGLLTTGARGKNAPPMVLLDAARLLLATVVTDKPSCAADAVADFGKLECHQISRAKKNSEFTFKNIRNIPNNHIFERAVEELLYIYAFDQDVAYYQKALQILGAEKYPPHSQMSIFLSNMNSEISIPGACYLYCDPFIRAASKDPADPSDERLQQWENESTALIDAYLERKLRYQTKIDVEKKISNYVTEDIATGFRKR